MYKFVYNSDKRIIVFKNASQLLRYLKPIDVANRNFRLYKSSKKGNNMHKNTNEIMRILDMLQENNEPVSLDGIYVCSYYELKSDLLADLNELVDTGVLIALADGTYARRMDLVKAAMEERARQEVEAILKKHGCEVANTYFCWQDEPGHTIGWFCKHPDCKGTPEHGNQNWTDWSRALHEADETDNVNTLYSGIEA